jgi:hypothetical protein
MTVNRTTLLDLPLPVTGTESGTWGDTTNNGLTQYLDIAIAGSLVLSADSDTTLSSTEGDSSATNIGGTTAQYAVLRCTGARTATRNINAPAWAISGGTISNYSKTYVVINDTTGGQSIVLRATNSATPTYTTGVTIVAGERAVCAWNGSDFVKVGGAAGGSNTQVQYNNNGVFGGITNATTDGTTLSMTSPKVITSINDTNGAELLKVTATASAVNELTLANAATGNAPTLSATGDDLNIGINITPKGTGVVTISNLAATTIDTTNIEVTNIKAKDGTAAASIADSTGAITVSTLLNVDNLRLDGNTLSSTNSNGAINLTPNGTGQVTVTNDASINGLTVGRGAGAVSTNTAVGASALAANTSGAFNIAVGTYALSGNTTGSYNSALGYGSTNGTTTGSYNTAQGYSSLNNISSGAYNTAVGAQALQANTTASNNTAVGYQAGYSNTTGTNNNFSGFQSGFWNTTGSQNTAFGVGSYASATTTATGSNNSSFGYQALYSNTTASNNTAVGYQAGYSQTGSDCNANVYIGYKAGYTTSGVGSLNLFAGTYAGYSNTTGIGNTYVGGGYNYGAGYYMTTGSKNTIIGSFTGNQGGLDIRTASNYIVLSDGDGNPRGYYTTAGDFVGVSANSRAFQSSVGISGGGYYYAYERVYPSSPVASTTVDSFRFTSIQTGAVAGNSLIVGRFYVYAQQTGGNSFIGTYDIQSHGNGTASATLTTVATSTRGTSPVTSVQIANDGVGGAIKLTITYNAFAGGGQPQASVFFDGMIA